MVSVCVIFIDLCVGIYVFRDICDMFVKVGGVCMNKFVCYSFFGW